MSLAQRCPKCDSELPAQGLTDACPGCGWRFASDAAQAVTRDDCPPQPPPPLPRFTGLDAEELSRRFPNFDFLELIGQGGMGMVYKVRQAALDRLVAIKILPPEVSRDPAFSARFVREARSLAKLNHPNIVIIHDFGKSDSLYYFVMELVCGGDLRRMIIGRGRLEPRDALAIASQICDALEYAHRQGVIHRDIKPENILLDGGRVKVADFGLAKLLAQTAPEMTLTVDQRVMGTPRYMAPEQMERPGAVDHRADIYSLGAVLYEMLTGEVPLGRFAAPSQKAPVDAYLDAVVLRCLERDPPERYQNASELKADLQGAVHKPAAVPAIPAALPYQAVVVDKSVRRRTDLAAVGLFVTAVLEMLNPIWIGVVWNREGPPPTWQWYWWVFLIAQISLVPLAGVFVFRGAARLRRLESPSGVRRAAWLALIPWAWASLIGLPVGIFVLRLLRRPNVKQAFAAVMENVTLAGRRPLLHRARLKTAAIIALILLVSAGVTSALMLSRPLGPPQRLFYTFAGYTPFVVGPNGPMLAGDVVTKMGLSKMQTDAANDIFQRYNRDFISLERRHTTFTTDDQGHVHITVAPFEAEANTLIDQMYAELGGVIDARRIPGRPIAGSNILRTMGLFRHEGRGQVTAELWKEGRNYHFSEQLHKDGNTLNSRGAWGSSSSDAIFPEEYRIYWRE